MNEEVVQDNQPVTSEPDLETPSDSPSPTKTPPKKMFFLGTTIGFLVCFVLIIAAYFYLDTKRKKITPLPALKPTPTPTITALVTTAPPLGWLDEPQQISSILVFKKEAELSQDLIFYRTDQAEFKKVAEFPDGSILIDSSVPLDAPGESPIIRFIQTKDKKYYCLTNYLDEWLKEEIGGLLLPNIILEEREIDGLTSPEMIEVDGQQFIKVRVLNQTFDILQVPRKIVDTAYGPIYEDRQEILESDQIFARGLYLKLKDNALVAYKLKVSFYSDDGIPEVFFDSSPGIKNQIVFTQRLASSCSLVMMNSVPIIKDGSSLIAGKKQIGKTVNGEAIYQMMEPTNELVKILYKYYSEGRDYPGGPTIESIEQMAAATNHFLWQDSLGDWQIFQNSYYELMAECGKPVIYLYPDKTTTVSVKVGALIHQSDPEYGEDGWRVIAYPNGTLIHQGQEYDSLFWEGLGEGFYPNLSNFGFVVLQENLMTSIKQHLSLLGLNQKEAGDFLEFWLPKLPKTPYVKLTWFGTREMDILAPLEVIPKPDTKIRIFLEFEGLKRPQLLKSQKLSSVKRVGFTLVEWGGLLRNQN